MKVCSKKVCTPYIPISTDLDATKEKTLMFVYAFYWGGVA
jgi:hypothetical protein